MKAKQAHSLPTPSYNYLLYQKIELGRMPYQVRQILVYKSWYPLADSWQETDLAASRETQSHPKKRSGIGSVTADDAIGSVTADDADNAGAPPPPGRIHPLFHGTAPWCVPPIRDPAV